jgi:predicted XRE-type DNA-binding protein
MQVLKWADERRRALDPDRGGVRKEIDGRLDRRDRAGHFKRVMKARRLTQAQAAEILGLDQPKVSDITSGRLEGFPTDRLMRFLNELGCDTSHPSEPSALKPRSPPCSPRVIQVEDVLAVRQFRSL